MIEVTGKYGTAKIFNDYVEETALAQVYAIMEHPVSKDVKVRFMPDIHAGAGATIGTTMEMKDRVVPNMIGVDIGCGVAGIELANEEIDFEKLDKVIRHNVPSGRNVRAKSMANTLSMEEIKYVFSSKYIGTRDNFEDFLSRIKEICNRTKQNYDYVISSIGTLGGGNHFIEINQDERGRNYLIVHSGSRNFGLKVALYHQAIAEVDKTKMTDEEYNKKLAEIKKKNSGKEIEIAIKKLKKEKEGKKKVTTTGMEFLIGEEKKQYIKDMIIAQNYAKLNRQAILYSITKNSDLFENINNYNVESVHNYIGDDDIVRKGAISAYEGEKVIIPLNMADGSLIGLGKGNKDWNYSAPHGAGRLMSRSKAKKEIKLEDFEKVMADAGIWTSCVKQSTLDESPMAYKNADEIIKYLEPTVEITAHLSVKYNYKADE